MLDVVDFDGNPTTKNYTISGIYQTTYQNQIPEIVRVYVNYIDIVKETYGENDMQTTYEQIKKDSALPVESSIVFKNLRKILEQATQSC